MKQTLVNTSRLNEFKSEVMAELPQSTGVADGSITPVKTSFVDVPLKDRCKVVQGKKLGYVPYRRCFENDENAFVVLIPLLSDDCAYIVCTPSNTQYAFGNDTTTSAAAFTNDRLEYIADASYRTVGDVGVITRKAANIPEGATYFAVSYTVGTDWDIEAVGVNGIGKVGISPNLLPNGSDFWSEPVNLVGTMHKVGWLESTSQFIPANKSTAFFRVRDGMLVYHNSQYLNMIVFDDHFRFVYKFLNVANGTRLDLAAYPEAAYAFITSTDDRYMPDDLWVSETDLSKHKYKPERTVNEKYLPYPIERKRITLPFKGAKAAFMGDSLTEDGSGGVYIKDLVNWFDFTDVSVSALGGTLVSGEHNAMGDPFWYDSRVNAISPDAEIVFIMGGTNDSASYRQGEAALGSPELSNCDTNTFYGAYHVLLSKLEYKFRRLESGCYDSVDYTGVTQADEAHDVQFVLITPPPMFPSKGSAAAGDVHSERINMYADAVLEVGKRTGCLVCDIRAEGGINPYNYTNYFGKPDVSDPADGTHLSAEAHHKWARVIASKLVEHGRFREE